MSAKAGWYPDPGGSPGLFRFWDGRAWSAVTTPDPRTPLPSIGLVDVAPTQPTQPAAHPSAQNPYAQNSSAQNSYGQNSYGQNPYGQNAAQSLQPAYAPAAYLGQSQERKKSAVGWWIGGGALVIVLVIIGVFAVRAVTGGGGLTGSPGGPGNQNVCPEPKTSASTVPHPNDGRVHGGPMSFPELSSPWQAPSPDTRVPFGSDTAVQLVDVEPNYQPGSNWVASILVAELQAGDGFFTPEQGSQIVVRCILGKFYGDNPVTSNVTVNKAVTIDGKDGWLVESQLKFDIDGLQTKGELLIVAIATTGATAGLYYASIPDSRPDLVPAARQAFQQLKVDS